MRGYMERQGWWDEDAESALVEQERKNVLEALSRAEVKAKPPLDSLFADVYNDIPRHLVEQQQAMLATLTKLWYTFLKENITMSRGLLQFVTW